MLQVLIGLFTSNRDGEDALQALQMLGLSPILLTKSNLC
jgi:hypothetical protein